MTDDGLPDELRAENTIRIGQQPRNGGEALRKLVWILPWLIFLGAPMQDLASGGTPPPPPRRAGWPWRPSPASI